MTVGAHELRERLLKAQNHHSAPSVSFEFFPPKNDQAEETFWRSANRLCSLNPRFMSLTYGADGSEKNRTQQFVSTMQRRGLGPVAPHLTCAGASQQQINELAAEYWESGIRHLVALRGDPAGGAGTRYQPHPDGYAYASDLVQALTDQFDFSLFVAAYPETHPEAPSAGFDLENLQRKLDAGAEAAITQYFFSTESFLRFRDAASRLGINKPIIPGILPISNFATIQRFSKACGTHLPRWLEDAFNGLDGNSKTHELIAANIAIEQVLALQAEGVEQFHFYTLNQFELCYAVCHALGVRENNDEVAA